ncbi:MAG: hypothetical protein ACOY71_12730 [Gemmatimonadota bacterium]
MVLHAEQRALLEKQHNFAEWQGARDAGGPPIRNFAFKGDELPGWELIRSRRNDVLDPPRLDTFWRPAGASADTLVGVRVVERPTVAAAREALLEVLGDIQSAVIVRRPDLDIGDVVFGQEFILAFTRGNLLVVVRNAGPKVIPITEVARALDGVVAKAMGER